MRAFLLFGVLATLWLLATVPAGAQTPGTLSAVPPPARTGIAIWGGGPIAQLVGVASDSGCRVESVSANRVASAGMVTYVPGAPGLVNQPFNAVYEGGLPVTAVAVRCAEAPADDFCATASLALLAATYPPTLLPGGSTGEFRIRYALPPGSSSVTFAAALTLDIEQPVPVADILAAFPDARYPLPPGVGAEDRFEWPQVNTFTEVPSLVADGGTHEFTVLTPIRSEAEFDANWRGFTWSAFIDTPFPLVQPPAGSWLIVEHGGSEWFLYDSGRCFSF